MIFANWTHLNDLPLNQFHPLVHTQKTDLCEMQEFGNCKAPSLQLYLGCLADKFCDHHASLAARRLNPRDASCIIQATSTAYSPTSARFFFPPRRVWRKMSSGS